MRYLGRQESLHDIDDIEAFVVMCIKRSGAQVRPSDWEDMIAEALVIVYKMAGDYDESKNIDGSAQFRFSGYAIRYLPKKIKEAWHRSHEEHLQKSVGDGKREWVYHKRAVSWDEVSVGSDRGLGSRMETPIDERTLRHPGNFVNPPAVDPRRVRTDAEE